MALRLISILKMPRSLNIAHVETLQPLHSDPGRGERFVYRFGYMMANHLRYACQFFFDELGQILFATFFQAG